MYHVSYAGSGEVAVEGWQLWVSLWEGWQPLAYCTHSNGGLASVWLALHTGMQLAICDYENADFMSFNDCAIQMGVGLSVRFRWSSVSLCDQMVVGLIVRSDGCWSDCAIRWWLV